MVAALLAERGDDRTFEARRQHVIRAIEGGDLEGAYKANPDGVTSPWLIPVEVVEEWFHASRSS